MGCLVQRKGRRSGRAAARLTGPRRVEVHEPGKRFRKVLPGKMLTAPGVLQNPVRVEALYDR